MNYCYNQVTRVVSSGHSPAFYVLFVPLEYVPTLPTHTKYVIINGEENERPKWLNHRFLHLQGCWWV